MPPSFATMSRSSFVHVRPPSDETRLFGLRMGVAGAVVAGVGVMFQTASLLVV